MPRPHQNHPQHPQKPPRATAPTAPMPPTQPKIGANNPQKRDKSHPTRHPPQPPPPRPKPRIESPWPTAPPQKDKTSPNQNMTAFNNITVFFNTGKKLPKNRNWTFPIVSCFTWKLKFVSHSLSMIADLIYIQLRSAKKNILKDFKLFSDILLFKCQKLKF